MHHLKLKKKERKKKQFGFVISSSVSFLRTEQNKALSVQNVQKQNMSIRNKKANEKGLTVHYLVSSSSLVYM